MGVLDDAIRQHLDLKRQHGASEQEVKRQEDEALGPVRRVARDEPSESDADASSASERRDALFDQRADSAAFHRESVEESDRREAEQSAAKATILPLDGDELEADEVPGGEALDTSRPPVREGEVLDVEQLAEEEFMSEGELEDEEEFGAPEPGQPEPGQPEPGQPEPVPPEAASRPQPESATIGPPEPEPESATPGQPAPPARPAVETDELVIDYDDELLDDDELLEDEEEDLLDEEARVREAEADPLDAEQNAGPIGSLPAVPGEPVEARDDDLNDDEAAEAELAAELADDELAEEEAELLEEGAPPSSGEEQGPTAAAAGDDVLEETPDFLQEAPEDERLWFEQKPPRDFDLDR